jgi:leucyl-tRNA synthetase
LTLVLHAYAPHITEELWEKLGHKPGSISEAQYPVFEPAHLVESEFNYPISINGKVRAQLSMPLDWTQDEVQSFVLQNQALAHHLEGKTVKKFIFVKGRIVNIVL